MHRNVELRQNDLAAKLYKIKFISQYYAEMKHRIQKKLQFKSALMGNIGSVNVFQNVSN